MLLFPGQQELPSGRQPALLVDVGRPSWGQQGTGEVFSTRDYITFSTAWQEEAGRRGQGQTRGHRTGGGVPVHVIFLWASVSFCGCIPAGAMRQRVYDPRSRDLHSGIAKNQGRLYNA